MCTRYIPPDVAEIEREWHIGRHNQGGWVPELFPLSVGPFLRRVGADAGLELVLGQWGMISRDSDTRIPVKSPKPGEKAKRISTVNARTESVASRPTFRDA